jgi:hypothetical protein
LRSEERELSLAHGAEELGEDGDLRLLPRVVGFARQPEQVELAGVVDEAAAHGGDRDDTAEDGLQKRGRVFGRGASMRPHRLQHPLRRGRGRQVVEDDPCVRVGNPFAIKRPNLFLDAFEHRRCLQ